LTRDAETNFYEALVTCDEEIKSLLLLARSVEVSPDNLAYTLRLARRRAVS
jgi:hypothetical protein